MTAAGNPMATAPEKASSSGWSRKPLLRPDQKEAFLRQVASRQRSPAELAHIYGLDLAQVRSLISNNSKRINAMRGPNDVQGELDEELQPEGHVMPPMPAQSLNESAMAALADEVLDQPMMVVKVSAPTEASAPSPAPQSEPAKTGKQASSVKPVQTAKPAKPSAEQQPTKPAALAKPVTPTAEAKPAPAAMNAARNLEFCRLVASGRPPLALAGQFGLTAVQAEMLAFNNRRIIAQLREEEAAPVPSPPAVDGIALVNMGNPWPDLTCYPLPGPAATATVVDRWAQIHPQGLCVMVSPSHDFVDAAHVKDWMAAMLRLDRLHLFGQTAYRTDSATGRMVKTLGSSFAARSRLVLGDGTACRLVLETLMQEPKPKVAPEQPKPKAKKVPPPVVNRLLTDEQREEFCRLRAGGMQGPELAARFGLTKSQAQSQIASNKERVAALASELKAQGSSNLTRQQLLSDEQRDELFRLKAGGTSNDDLAVQFNLTRRQLDGMIYNNRDRIQAIRDELAAAAGVNPTPVVVSPGAPRASVSPSGEALDSRPQDEPDLDPLVQANCCKELWCAVLTTALHDAEAGQPEAVSFITASGAWAQSFTEICLMAGVEPDVFRAKAKERMANGKKSRARRQQEAVAA